MIELLIVVAIIGLLAAIALPAYNTYIKRSAYAEVIAGLTPFKTAVSDCFQSTGSLAGCDAGGQSVPPGFTGKTEGALNGVAVTGGVITATPNAVKGILASDTCRLTPSPSTANPDYLVWTYSASLPCVTKGYVAN